MDKWKYYDITHQNHVYMNPMQSDKFNRFVQLLDLADGSSVIDIACGNGELLINLVEAYQVSAVGIDLSPYTIERARKQVVERVPNGEVTLIEGDGGDYVTEKPHSFDLASCIGASWVFNGHAGTLEALTNLVKPSGWLIAGEPYWLKEPDETYLKRSGMTRQEFRTHFENVQVGEQQGLNLVHTFVSSQDDWDIYEGLQWLAVDSYARANPDDPDLPELLARVAKEKELYLKWGRDTLGWAIYLFKRNESSQ